MNSKLNLIISLMCLVLAASCSGSGQLSGEVASSRSDLKGNTEPAFPELAAPQELSRLLGPSRQSSAAGDVAFI